MNFNHETDESNSKFKQVVLPPGFLDEPSDETVRVTASEPTDQPADSAPRNARRTMDPASGRETWNRRLRPRHRAVVRSYFDSSSEPDSP